jgi:hypothetical protein
MGNGANGLRVWCNSVSGDVECFNHSISSSVNLVLEYIATKTAKYCEFIFIRGIPVLVSFVGASKPRI